MGVAPSTERLDTFTPRYLDGTIAWAAIGARNVESQDSRHMASGLSMPVGYKNATSGKILNTTAPVTVMIAHSLTVRTIFLKRISE